MRICSMYLTEPAFHSLLVVYPLSKKNRVFMSLAHSADVPSKISLKTDALAPGDPASTVDLNVMVRMALNQAAPHINWSTVADEEVLRLCPACHGIGIEQVGPATFGGCQACLDTDVKVCIVRTVEHPAKETRDSSIMQFLSHVPEASISEETRVMILAALVDAPRDLRKDMEEGWVALRGDGTCGQGPSPIEAFLDLERTCEDRDSVLALLARKASIPEEVHAKVVQIVAQELHSA